MMPPFPHAEELDIPAMDLSPMENRLLAIQVRRYGISGDNYARMLVLKDCKAQGLPLSPALDDWLTAVLGEMARVDSVPSCTFPTR